MRAYLVVAAALFATFVVADSRVAGGDTCADQCKKVYETCAKKCNKNDTNCFTNCLSEQSVCLVKCR